MSEDLIRYDVLAQEAMRGVVRKVLTEVAQTGLPGDHHFFITFDTNYSGVRVSSRIREQYPQDMTIVLQHQFWDLSVTDTTLEVGLSFNSIPERLLIPFRAITAFVDPHANFGLKLEADAVEDDNETAAMPALADVDPVSALPAPDDADGAIADQKNDPDTPAETDDAEETAATVEPQKEEKQPDTGGAEVVSLDAFRKKNG